MDCPKCNKEIMSGDKFCSNCGRKISVVKSKSENNKKESIKERLEFYLIIIINLIIWPYGIYYLITDKNAVADFLDHLIIFGIIIIIVVIGGFVGLVNGKKEETYKETLKNLQSNPDDSTLRVEALKAGREYYASKRKNNKLTITDELAIRNDLDI